MTNISDVKDDPSYIPCLDYGFVGLVDHMGDDTAICQAARTSYGQGTRSVSEDRALIRYLVNHRHTSPIEMAEVKFHIKLPIFVMRQLVRHRTASLNEYSGRYSVMSDEFYMPAGENIKAQSTDNKQGRAAMLSDDNQADVIALLKHHNEMAYDNYEALLGTHEISDGFPGVARELARIVLPVSNYTELYWKQNLHNLLHLIKLRRDAHAQYEIRVFAEAMYQHIKPIYPLTCEAWEDYVWDGVHSSRMEKEVLRGIISEWKTTNNVDQFLASKSAHGLGSREVKEFKAKWNL